MKRILFFLILICGLISAQDQILIDSLKTEKETVAEIENLNSKKSILEFNPKKSGWKSAILPGWGQYYNRKYWKIPVIWGAMGTGVGFIIWNQKQYSRYRSAFGAELRGEKHDFSDIKGIDLKTALGNTQDIRKRQRDYAIAITVGIYILNIIDAVVDAHLYEGRKDPDLAFSPTVLQDLSGIDATPKVGLSLNYRF